MRQQQFIISLLYDLPVQPLQAVKRVWQDRFFLKNEEDLTGFKNLSGLFRKFCTSPTMVAKFSTNILRRCRSFTGKIKRYHLLKGDTFRLINSPKVLNFWRVFTRPSGLTDFTHEQIKISEPESPGGCNIHLYLNIHQQEIVFYLAYKFTHF